MAMTTEALEIDLESFADQLDSAFVIDVRDPAEYLAGHVPGAVLLPLATLLARITDLPRDRTVFVICAAGTRSLAAAKTLAVAGIDALSVAGGTTAWIRSHRPVSIGRSAA
jgi:rhodanese-related sulfurtransferase